MQGIGKEKFGELYQNIQAQYGAKPEQRRDAKKTLDKDDFLKIMMTQMKHQDPTNPFKADQMASEIAQFTTVEQLHNVNQNLVKLAQQQKPFEKLEMSHILGKTVTIDRSQFVHQKGEQESLRFYLPENARSVEVGIYNLMGECVFQKQLGPQSTGVVHFQWEGLDTSGSESKTGHYVFRVDAKEESGQRIAMNPKTEERVIGLSFEGQEPVFLVGDSKHQEKITLQNIVQIHATEQEKTHAQLHRSLDGPRGFPNGLEPSP